MSAELKTKILAEWDVVYFDEYNLLLLAVGVFDFLARPLRAVGMSGIHKQKNFSVVNGINNDINKLSVTFYSCQVYPTTPPPSEYLYLIL